MMLIIHWLVLLCFPCARLTSAAPGTLYDILGVDQKANEKEMQRSYRRLALRWHPDKQSTPEQRARATRRFALIQSAYDTLRKPRLRAQYDMKLLQQQARVRRHEGGAQNTYNSGGNDYAHGRGYANGYGGHVPQSGSRGRRASAAPTGTSRTRAPFDDSLMYVSVQLQRWIENIFRVVLDTVARLVQGDWTALSDISAHDVAALLTFLAAVFGAFFLWQGLRGGSRQSQRRVRCHGDDGADERVGGIRSGDGVANSETWDSDDDEGAEAARHRGRMFSLHLRCSAYGAIDAQRDQAAGARDARTSTRTRIGFSLRSAIPKAKAPAQRDCYTGLQPRPGTGLVVHSVCKRLQREARRPCSMLGGTQSIPIPHRGDLLLGVCVKALDAKWGSVCSRGTRAETLRQLTATSSTHAWTVLSDILGSVEQEVAGPGGDARCCRWELALNEATHAHEMDQVIGCSDGDGEGERGVVMHFVRPLDQIDADEESDEDVAEVDEDEDEDEGEEDEEDEEDEDADEDVDEGDDDDDGSCEEDSNDDSAGITRHGLHVRVRNMWSLPCITYVPFDHDQLGGQATSPKLWFQLCCGSGACAVTVRTRPSADHEVQPADSHLGDRAAVSRKVASSDIVAIDTLYTPAYERETYVRLAQAEHDCSRRSTAAEQWRHARGSDEWLFVWGSKVLRTELVSEGALARNAPLLRAVAGPAIERRASSPSAPLARYRTCQAAPLYAMPYAGAPIEGWLETGTVFECDETKTVEYCIPPLPDANNWPVTAAAGQVRRCCHSLMSEPYQNSRSTVAVTFVRYVAAPDRSFWTVIRLLPEQLGVSNCWAKHPEGASGIDRLDGRDGACVSPAVLEEIEDCGGVAHDARSDDDPESDCEDSCHGTPLNLDGGESKEHKDDGCD